MLSVSLLLCFLLIGLFVVDADLAMQKKGEVKALLELANHHATFAIDQDLKNEGIIEMTEAEALNRFDQRMDQNGGFKRENAAYIPSSSSITTDALPVAHYYVDFRNWRKDLRVSFRYTGDTLKLEKVQPGDEHTSGGELEVAIITPDAKELQLSPKRMIGPSLVAVAYVDERPFVPLLPAHSFPVLSVEELKW